MPSLFALPSSLAEWGRLIATAFLVGALCYALGNCDGSRGERQKWEAEVADQRAKAETQQRRADGLMREMAIIQQAKIAGDRKEVNDAVKDIPDQAPSARQRARACLELRRQATDARRPAPAC